MFCWKIKMAWVSEWIGELRRCHSVGRWTIWRWRNSMGQRIVVFYGLLLQEKEKSLSRSDSRSRSRERARVRKLWNAPLRSWPSFKTRTGGPWTSSPLQAPIPLTPPRSSLEGCPGTSQSRPWSRFAILCSELVVAIATSGFSPDLVKIFILGFCWNWRGASWVAWKRLH